MNLVDIQKDIRRTEDRCKVAGLFRLFPISTYVFSFSRILFTLSLILILFSLIPSFYPVYKSLVAPSLPHWIQQFFSDVKHFFLVFFGFYLSGKSFDEVVSLLSSDPLAAVPIQISLQDWIYSYILHCNLYHDAVAFRQLCSQCRSLSPIEQWRSARLDLCQDCELCVDFKPHAAQDVSFFKDDGCSQLLNDILGIVRSGSPHPASSSPREILRDCFATFVLYLRFYTHLLLRTGVRFLLSCSRVASSLFLVLQWVLRDIVQSAESNPTRAVALSCSVLAVAVALFLALHAALRLIKMVLDDVVALTTDPAKRAARNPAARRAGRKPRGSDAGESGEGSELGNAGTAGNAGRGRGAGSMSESGNRGLNDSNDSNDLNDPNDPNDRNGPNYARNTSNAGGGRGTVETGKRGDLESRSVSKSPLWLSLEGEPTYKGNGKGVAENWSAILRDNEWIAELLIQCSEADDLNSLLNLLEQLHDGDDVMGLRCRKAGGHGADGGGACRRVRSAQSSDFAALCEAAERRNGRIAVSGRRGTVADVVLADRAELDGL